MQSRDLREILSAIGVSQADFARLVGVTARAVSLWMAGDREIPGAVEAYARLLHALPASLRQIELGRLKQRRTSMRDGMYAVQYQSSNGSGLGTLILENGKAWGADPYGGAFDGDYLFDEASGLAELRMKVTFKANAESIFGIRHPYEWSIDLTTWLDPKADQGNLTMATPIGKSLDARYRFLRGLPNE
jgi:transcriptional regulator with XRE-family HTH domain